MRKTMLSVMCFALLCASLLLCQTAYAQSSTSSQADQQSDREYEQLRNKFLDNARKVADEMRTEHAIQLTAQLQSVLAETVQVESQYATAKAENAGPWCELCSFADRYYRLLTTAYSLHLKLYLPVKDAIGKMDNAALLLREDHFRRMECDRGEYDQTSKELTIAMEPLDLVMDRIQQLVAATGMHSRIRVHEDGYTTTLLTEHLTDEESRRAALRVLDLRTNK